MLTISPCFIYICFDTGSLPLVIHMCFLRQEDSLIPLQRETQTYLKGWCHEIENGNNGFQVIDIKEVWGCWSIFVTFFDVIFMY
jgi:hypothetical protein